MQGLILVPPTLIAFLKKDYCYFIVIFIAIFVVIFVIFLLFCCYFCCYFVIIFVLIFVVNFNFLMIQVIYLTSQHNSALQIGKDASFYSTVQMVILLYKVP